MRTIRGLFHLLPLASIGFLLALAQPTARAALPAYIKIYGETRDFSFPTFARSEKRSNRGQLQLAHGSGVFATAGKS